MPSTLVPSTVVTPGSGPKPQSESLSVKTKMTAHLTDPVDAHDASAISYAGGANWADGTTNPAATVEVQLDKIITDLGSGDGLGKIAYNGGANWADGTTNPATTGGSQIDKIITDLIGQGAGTSGARKLGVEATTVGAVALGADTLYARISALQSAASINCTALANWADGTTNPETSVQLRVADMVNVLASKTGMDDGAEKVGAAADASFFLEGTVRSQLDQLRDQVRGTYLIPLSSPSFQTAMAWQFDVAQLCWTQATSNTTDEIWWPIPTPVSTGGIDNVRLSLKGTQVPMANPPVLQIWRLDIGGGAPAVAMIDSVADPGGAGFTDLHDITCTGGPFPISIDVLYYVRILGTDVTDTDFYQLVYQVV